MIVHKIDLYDITYKARLTNIRRALFSVFTAVTVLSRDPVIFCVKRIGATTVTLMFSGYSVGDMLAAVLGENLIETQG
jgi:hypothetical protein